LIIGASSTPIWLLNILVHDEFQHQNLGEQLIRR
jgi:hypothetical protein